MGFPLNMDGPDDCFLRSLGYHSTDTAAASLSSTATERQMQHDALENIPLPHGIRSRFVPNIKGDFSKRTSLVIMLRLEGSEYPM